MSNAASTLAEHSDLVVVGAGIVGLGHAVEAVRRGMSVTVVDREDRVVGASVRNFGHGCATAQSGVALELAMATRKRWLELGRDAGFWVGETGSVVVARADDELAVLEQLAAERDGVGVQLLDSTETARRAGGVRGVVGGAFLDQDLRVDPRVAAPAIARWLAEQPGVRFVWDTLVYGAADGVVATSRGPMRAGQVVLCPGHDVSWLAPELAADAGLRRCRLHMLRVSAPDDRVVAPAVLTGLSMLRYTGMSAQPAAADVRARFERERPELLEHGVNLMLTQRPDGDLLIGDTHHYVGSVDAFQSEALDELLLDETARLLGVPSLRVRERWMGVYAAASAEFLVAQPAPRTTVVAVTSGIGMTTALGLAAAVVDAIVDGRTPDLTAPLPIAL